MIVTTNSKNKVVFAVTSKGNDFYSAMTRVAVASLRLSNPDFFIIVASDHETDMSMKHARDPLIEEVDCWLKVDTPTGSDGFRNRFVKTNLRKLIDGPFLFLDSDVLVRDDLSKLFDLECDIAGARNHSANEYETQIWFKDAEMLKLMGWSILPDVYINGGVLLWNDTPGAHRLVTDWHQRWLCCIEKHHNYRDQPSLNSALQAIQPILHVLPNRFNSQFRRNFKTTKDAAVWHYYSSAMERPQTQFELVVDELIHGKPLNLVRIEKLIRDMHPWLHNNAFGNWLLERLVARGRFDGWEAAVLCGGLARYQYCRFQTISSLFFRIITRSKA